MSFLLNVLGALIIVGALIFLLTRRRRRTIALEAAVATGAGPVSVGHTAGPWTRSDRIAFASLVVGAVLGVLGLLAR